MKHYLLCGLTGAAVIAGCASYPRPDQNVALSIAAARGAEEAGAAEVPEAQLQLKLAQDQIDAAQKLMKEEKYERADYMSLRAFYDAELALAIAREHAAKEVADQTVRAAALRRSQLNSSQASNQE